MDAGDWLSIAALCTAGAMSPGPSLAVVLKNTIAGGRAQGAATGVGHGLGIGIYAFGTVAGLTALIESVPGLHRMIEILGVLYLLWMAMQSLRHAGRHHDEDDSTPTPRGFSEGFFLAFLNPKTAVFFLALLGSVVPTDAVMVERAGVAAMAMGIDIAWFVFVAVVVAGSGAVGSLRRHAATVDRVLGLLLIALAIGIVVRIVGGG
ncbi:MAG: LysE family translocator [Myxococcota bacterium]